jgi:squalene-hopene/tetraprenyl-beta-curcumene cyclase
VKNPSNATGGWSFEFYNRWYPDVDDSAVVVMALDAVRLADEEQERVKRGAMGRAVGWIASMQCRAGGWAAFDKDNDREWLNAMPFGDLKAMVDPNTADVTARVLEMLGRLRLSKDNLGLLPPAKVAERGIEYLLREQEAEGRWFGRWGVNYIYGTSGAVAALALLSGPAPNGRDRMLYEDEIGRAARWLVAVQNHEDGGWGEATSTYDNGSCPRKETFAVSPRAFTTAAADMDVAESDGGSSTASQTAWALIALLSAGQVLGRYETEAIERGVAFLLRTQRADGSWCERRFTGTGFPVHFYIRYHYYAQHFPLTALGRYQSARLRHSL